MTTALLGVELLFQQALISRYCREAMAVQLLWEPSSQHVAVWIEYLTLTDWGPGGSRTSMVAL